MPEEFSHPAAYGDLLAAVLALVAALALRNGWPAAIALAWVFNVVGFVDLLNALFQGVLHNPPGAMGPAFFIPAIPVPLLLVSHVVLFRVLMRRE